MLNSLLTPQNYPGKLFVVEGIDGFRIEDEDLEDLKTVRDAVDYVHAKLAAG